MSRGRGRFLFHSPWLRPAANSQNPSQGNTGLVPHPPEGHPCPLLSLFSENGTRPRVFPYQTRKAEPREGADRLTVTQLVRSGAGARTRGSRRPAPDGLPTIPGTTSSCALHSVPVSALSSHARATILQPRRPTHTGDLNTKAITREEERGRASGQPDDRPTSVSGLGQAAALQPRLPGQTAGRSETRLRRTRRLTARTPTTHTAL